MASILWSMSNTCPKASEEVPDEPAAFVCFVLEVCNLDDNFGTVMSSWLYTYPAIRCIILLGSLIIQNLLILQEDPAVLCKVAF